MRRSPNAGSSTGSRKHSISVVQRRDPPLAAPEKETLTAFLDYHRDTLLLKIDGVSDEDLRRSMPPSDMTLLGIVKHLAFVERGWFQGTFLGDAIETPWTTDDPDADFRIEPDETTQQIVDLYRAECEKSRAIVEAASLDDRAKRHGRTDYTLRWIMAHMIEETARHNGHADLFRERIDGVTGE